MVPTAGPTGIAPTALSIVITRPKSGSVNFRLNLCFIAALHVLHLAEFGERIIGCNRPKNEALTRRCFLQVVETHVDLGRSVFTRRDENIRARTRESTGEIYFDFGVIAFFVSRDIEQWRRVSGLGFASSGRRSSFYRLSCRPLRLALSLS